MNTEFFNQIYNIYSSVKIKAENKDFYSLNNIVYYLSDAKQNIIKADNNIIEIDIKSAFPTICKILFKDDPSFLNKLHELEDKKLERNIFISTTLKGSGYLKQLNLISKMIISSLLMSNDPDAVILELKKDGIVYIGKSVLGQSQILDYYTSLGFIFHETKYNKYVRCQKTSYFVHTDNSLVIKGIYKDRPDFLYKISQKILTQDYVDYNFLNKIYSKKYFQIIKHNILDELFLKYYNCQENKYLNKNFRYNKIKLISSIDDLTPKNYLKLFIYPLITEI